MVNIYSSKWWQRWRSDVSTAVQSEFVRMSAVSLAQRLSTANLHTVTTWRVAVLCGIF